MRNDSTFYTLAQFRIPQFGGNKSVLLSSRPGLGREILEDTSWRSWPWHLRSWPWPWEVTS